MSEQEIMRAANNELNELLKSYAALDERCQRLERLVELQAKLIEELLPTGTIFYTKQRQEIERLRKELISE